jgi:hypothetical protein
MVNIGNKRHWLLIGHTKNWETALEQSIPIWGLKPRYQVEFQAMKIGDFLWFYSTMPVRGVIGVGVVKDKYVDNMKLIWEDEIKSKEVIWPLRFRIQVLKVLPGLRWKNEKIKINDFNIFWQTSLQVLSVEYAVELLNRSKKCFGTIDENDLFVGPTLPLLAEEKSPYGPREEPEISHREMQNKIAEIGKLQFYYTEIEHSIELPGERKNLDVVWKREIDGVPTFAFEIEFSSMFEKAVERLKIAFRKWNSRPRIVVPNDSLRKVHNIVSGTDKDFSEQVKIYESVQIADLLKLKHELKALEQKLDLY